MNGTGINLVICNGCLQPLDPEREHLIRVGEFTFHLDCAPTCASCGRRLPPGGTGQHAACAVLDSRAEFVAGHGYYVRLRVCCCGECHESALHDEPTALA